jgi:2-desacetyl-2-hydroxyethyl bacteriochlorophyllide A dehydrogenase
MKAVVLKSAEDLVVSDVPEFSPEPGQAIVRVNNCGICGSDVRYYYGENPWAKQTLGMNVANPPNIILGHEFSGVVEQVADEQDQELVGKRVAVNTFITCGRCDNCRAGKENICVNTKHLGHGQGWGEMDFYPGGMAERCPVFANQVYPLPDHVTDEQATFLDPMIAALHATDVGAPTLLDDVAILGAGPIGLLIGQFAKAYGANRTFISDIAAENLAVAQATGIGHALDVSKNETALYDCVMDTTDGAGVHIVYNTIGTQASIEQSLRMLRKGGTLVLLATKDENISFPALLLSGERTIRTSSNAMYSDFPRALEMLASGIVDVVPLISHRFPLTSAVEAFEAACDKAASGAIKVVIDCQS